MNSWKTLQKLDTAQAESAAKEDLRTTTSCSIIQRAGKAVQALQSHTGTCVAGGTAHAG